MESDGNSGFQERFTYRFWKMFNMSVDETGYGRKQQIKWKKRGFRPVKF